MNGTSASPLGAPPIPPQPWRLVRARNDKVAGVCAGLAAASGVDVTLIRIAFLLAGLGGFGIVIYLVLIFVVPKEDPAKGNLLQPAPAHVAQWIRVGLAVAGVLGLVSIADGSPPFFDNDGFGFGLGVCLLAIGAVVIWVRRGRPGLPSSLSNATGWSPSPPTTGSGFPPPAPSSSVVPPAPPSGPDAAASTTAWPQPTAWPVAEPTTVMPTTVTPTTPTTTYASVPAPAPPYPQTPRTSGAVIAARVFGWLTVIATVPVAIAVGALVRVRALSLPLPFLFLALAAAVVINLIVWSSVAKRVAFILVAMSLPLVLASVVALASHWNGAVGERIERPTTRAAVTEDFQMAIGHQVVDLSALQVTGDPVSVRADLRIGLLEVIVPDDVAVQVESSVSAGALHVFGTERDGSTISYETESGASETSRFELDLDVGYGRLDVCRASDARLVDATLRCTSAP